MDVDVDYDVDDDSVKRYLQNRLSEITAKNYQLEQTLQGRRQFLKNIVENHNILLEEGEVEIIPEVQKIFNAKYVIIDTIINKTDRQLDVERVVVNWNSRHPFTYQVNLYEIEDISRKNFRSILYCREHCNAISSSVKESYKIDKSAYLIITFDVPQFTEKMSYSITGSIIFRQDDKEKCQTLPSIEVSSLDATNCQMNEFPNWINGARDILTITSASVKTDLVMIFPSEWPHSPPYTFENLCGLTNIRVQSGCRQFFVAVRLSPSFDDSLVEIHAPTKEHINDFFLVVYTRNEDRLLPLLHHLHRNIPGVVIIPKALHENYILDKIGRDQQFAARRETQYADAFNKYANIEMKYVLKCEQERKEGKKIDPIKFRSDLAELEKNTDRYYLRLCKINGNI